MKHTHEGLMMGFATGDLRNMYLGGKRSCNIAALAQQKDWSRRSRCYKSMSRGYKIHCWPAKISLLTGNLGLAMTSLIDSGFYFYPKLDVDDHTANQNKTEGKIAED